MSLKPEGFTLEIDGVRTALSSGRSFTWELGDTLADRYWEAIDLATAPGLTEQNRAAVVHRLHYLRAHKDFIAYRLVQENGYGPLTGVADAYPRVLAQLEAIIELAPTTS